jgi:hypothetical protein
MATISLFVGALLFMASLMDTAERSVNRIVFDLSLISVSLQVTALRASANNQASTVLNLFLDGTDDFGFPSRVRGNRGGENMDVAVFMIMRNGPKRASFIWGT